MQILVKVGSKYPDPRHPSHLKGWLDGQVIDIRPDGYYTSRMDRQHHCVVDVPTLDYWSLRGSTDWKSISAKALDFKKLLSVADEQGRYVWENGFTESKSRKRDYFVDFKGLLDNRHITESQYDSIYAKDRQHARIELNFHDLMALLKHEDVETRLDPSRLQTKGTISTGTYSIGSGLDYADLATFEADIESQLTGNLTGEHANEETSISAAVTFDLDTNSYLLKITAASGAEHNGGAYGNGARINFGTNDQIGLNETNDGDLDDVEISKLAIDASGSGNVGIYAYDGSNSGTFTIDRMLLKGDGNSNYPIRVDSAANNILVKNSIVYEFSSGYLRFGGTTATAYNNTVISCSYGIVQSAGTVTIKNNLVQNSTNDDYSGTFTSAKNVSEDATSPDVAYRSQNCHDGNSCFVDYANDDYRLTTGGDEQGTLDDGDDLSGTFTDDIIGTTRSTWFIGAYELVTSSSSSSQSSSSNSSSSSSLSSSCSSSLSSSSSSESMGVSVAVKFDTTAGIVNFYDDEISVLHLDTNQKIDLFYKNDNFAHMYRIGAPYKTIQIVLNQQRADAIDRAESLFDLIDSFYQPEIFTCYYEYKINQSSSLQMQMLRDAFVLPYNAGEKDAKSIVLYFVEASSASS